MAAEIASSGSLVSVEMTVQGDVTERHDRLSPRERFLVLGELMTRQFIGHSETLWYLNEGFRGRGNLFIELAALYRIDGNDKGKLVSISIDRTENEDSSLVKQQSSLNVDQLAAMDDAEAHLALDVLEMGIRKP